MASFILSLLPLLVVGSPCSAPRDDYDWTPITEVDVAVVGGGFSGMTAAYHLHQSGLKVALLEATDRLGGRSRSHSLETGPGLVELGATWINNKTQPEVTALVEEFGLEFIVQYTDGYEVRQMLDGTVTFGGDEEDDTAEDLVSY
jgi:monoamine oxidase